MFFTDFWSSRDPPRTSKTMVSCKRGINFHEIQGLGKVSILTQILRSFGALWAAFSAVLGDLCGFENGCTKSGFPHSKTTEKDAKMESFSPFWGSIFDVLGTLAPKGTPSDPGSAKMREKLSKWSQKDTKIEVKWNRKGMHCQGTVAGLPQASV